jgi:hypothetical protein|tara:strand:+ start:1293 stop:1463 length:171 start_codon:yes stop_codon:yes gene_type:complete
MQYKRKTLPKVEIIQMNEDSVDDEGNKVVGVVSYINEFGSKGVMTYKQFIELYEEM